MPDGEYALGRAARAQVPGWRAPGRRHAGRQHADDGPGAAQPGQQIGLALDDAARRVSTYPADYLGATDIGRLVPGASADIVVMDRELKLQRVIVQGEEIELDEDAR
jgi:N-acetylglucosamine-6-phosphate deacetylase